MNLSWLKRHFTWVSATVVLVALFSIFLLVLVYVPEATTNAAVNTFLTATTVLSGLLSLLSLIKSGMGWVEENTITEDIGEDDQNEDTLSSPARGFERTNQDRMREAMEDLDGWFSFGEEGNISFHSEGSNIQGDRRNMLYVFAVRVAYEANNRDSPLIDNQELVENLEISAGEANVFISKMEDWVERRYDREEPRPMHAIDNRQFELNLEKVPEVTEYIRGERRAPH